MSLPSKNLGSEIGGESARSFGFTRLHPIFEEVEVAWFLTAVLAGNFYFLRHLDICNREGLVSECDWYDQCFSSRIIPLKEVLEERPDICILAEFSSEGRVICSTTFRLKNFICSLSPRIGKNWWWELYYWYSCLGYRFGSFFDIEQMVDSEFNCEINLPSQLCSHTSDGSLLTSSSESSYNSEQGSRNEEGQNSGNVIF